MRKSLVAFLVAACTATIASAAPITVPSSLSPGDQYRLVFVTSTVRDATSSNIADYNSFVTTAANSVPELVALGTTWTAIASTANVSARDNTGTSPNISTGVPIYRLDSALIASNNADLWDGAIAATLSITEFGDPSALLYVWTGSDGHGIQFNTRVLGGPNPTRGQSNATTFQWMLAATVFPDNTYSLYAMSGVLTVVPEPSSLMLLGFFGVGLAGYAWHIRKRKVRVS